MLTEYIEELGFMTTNMITTVNPIVISLDYRFVILSNHVYVKLLLFSIFIQLGVRAFLKYESVFHVGSFVNIRQEI